MLTSGDNPIQENGQSSNDISGEQELTANDNHVQEQAQEVHSGGAPLTCIRVGCPNKPVVNSEWEDEYCSNECVVSHCRDVFSCWVASNQNAAVK